MTWPDSLTAYPTIAFLAALGLHWFQLRGFHAALWTGALGCLVAIFFPEITTLFVILVFTDALYAVQAKSGRLQVHLWLTLLPVLVGLLLKWEGVWLAGCVMATVLFRGLLWPWQSAEKDPALSEEAGFALLMAVSCLVLWKTQSAAHTSEGGLAFLILACLSSFGGKTRDVGLLFGLGLFSISPETALLAPLLWPLTVVSVWASYGVVPFMAIAGALLHSQSQKILPEEIALGFAILSGLLCARALVSFRPPQGRWPLEVLTGLTMAGYVGALIYYFGESYRNWEFNEVGQVFALSLTIVYSLGVLLSQKRPKIFKSLPGFDALEALAKKIQTAQKSDRFLGAEQSYPILKIHDRVLAAIYSESILGLLLGALGIFLMWCQA